MHIRGGVNKYVAVLLLIVVIVFYSCKVIYCASNISGNDFVTMSESSKRGYITGYLDGYSVLGQMKKTVNIPSKATYVQLYDVIIKFLNDHPERRHYPIEVLVWGALMDSYGGKEIK